MSLTKILRYLKSPKDHIYLIYLKYLKQSNLNLPLTSSQKIVVLLVFIYFGIIYCAVFN
jgi:hypothetical protein